MSRTTRSQHDTIPNVSMKVKKGRHDSVQGSSKQDAQKKKAVTATKHNLRRSTRNAPAQPSSDQSTDGDADEGEEESGNEQDELPKDAEDPEVIAPFDGTTEIKPATANLELEHDAEHEAKEDGDHRTGLNDDAEPLEQITKSQGGKQSSLNEREGSSDSTVAAYPRQQGSRRLSNNQGFLAYEDVQALGQIHDSAIAESDDDDYTAVDQISDSESSDADVEESETKAIISTENLAPKQGGRPVRDVSVGIEINPELDFGTTATDGTSFFAEQMERMPEDHSILMLGAIHSSPETPNTRKVHFADNVMHSPSDSDTTEETTDLPDLFMDVSVNMAGLQNMSQIGGRHSPNSYSNSDDGSYWDWTEDEGAKLTPNGSFVSTGNPMFPLPALDTEEDMESEEGSSSGYDTDDSGDTTDDEMPPPPKAPITPKALLRSYKPPTSKKTAFKHAGRPVRAWPILGQFAVEKDKAIAFLHASRGTVVLRRGHPQHQRFVDNSDVSSTAQSSPTTAFQSIGAEDSDFSEVSRTPITGSMDIMFSGMFGGASNQSYNFGGQVIGPPEAFYPFKAVDSNGIIVDADDESYDDDEEDPEDQIDLSTFIEGLSDGEENDGDDDVEMGMSYAEESESDAAFGLQSPAATDTSSMMTPFNGYEPGMFPSSTLFDHFGGRPGLVNSFRAHQDRIKRLTRLPYDPAKRTAASQPLRSGYTANSVITPARKRRAADKGSLSSPMHAKTGNNRIMKPPRRPKLPPRGFF